MCFYYLFYFYSYLFLFVIRKILIIGSHLNFNLEHFFKINLERLNKEVSFIGYKTFLKIFTTPVRMVVTRSKNVRSFLNPVFLDYFNKHVKKIVEEKDFDIILVVKGEAVFSSTLEWIRNEIGIKTVLYYPDDPRYFNALTKHIIQHYDFIFTASKRIINLYKKYGARNVYYLPFGCDENIHRRLNLKKEFDVVFVGVFHPKRFNVVKNLIKNHIQIKVYGPYWNWFMPSKYANPAVYGSELTRVFNQAKIILNIHFDEDIPFRTNMRTFEACGCGGFLLTDTTYDLSDLFEINEEVITYEDYKKDIVSLIKYYLEEDSEREMVSVKAQKKAYRKHTYLLRMKELLKKVK